MKIPFWFLGISLSLWNIHILGSKNVFFAITFYIEEITLFWRLPQLCPKLTSLSVPQNPLFSVASSPKLFLVVWSPDPSESQAEARTIGPMVHWFGAKREASTSRGEMRVTVTQGTFPKHALCSDVKVIPWYLIWPDIWNARCLERNAWNRDHHRGTGANGQYSHVTLRIKHRVRGTRFHRIKRTRWKNPSSFIAAAPCAHLLWKLKFASRKGQLRHLWIEHSNASCHFERPSVPVPQVMMWWEPLRTGNVRGHVVSLGYGHR